MVQRVSRRRWFCDIKLDDGAFESITAVFCMCTVSHDDGHSSLCRLVQAECQAQTGSKLVIVVADGVD